MSSTYSKKEVPNKFKPGFGECVYEYFINNYLFHWYQGKTVSPDVYSRASIELMIIKNQKEKAEKKGKKKGNASHNPERIKEQEEVEKLDKSPPKVSRPRSSKSCHSEGQRIVTTKDLERKIDRLNQELENLNEMLAGAHAQLNEKNMIVRKMNDDLKNYRDEVDDLRTRLSKLAGDKLRDNNPNLADLSDTNRPTELGKRFSEIYDNDWSDAFENIPNKTEEERIRILHEVAMSSYQYCDETFRRQVPEIRGILLQENMESNNEVEMKTFKTENIHNNLKEIRKRFAPITAQNVAKNFIEERLDELLQGLQISDIHGSMRKYAGKCAEICWFMVVCDPPMVMSEDKEGMKFNTNIYRPYTRSEKNVKNPVVEYNVWPALYLHYEGPMVAKGVAQPNAKQ